MTAIPVRILALGDSYTIGASVDPDQRWPNQLASSIRASGLSVEEPIIIARTGWATDELSDAIQQSNPQGPFDLVTVQIGVNDQFRGYPLDSYREGFLTLLGLAIDLAGGDPTRVIVLSIPDWGVTPFAEGRDRSKIAAEIDIFNQVNRQETEAAGARYVDVTPISRQVADDSSLLGLDQLHPAGKMYAAWVELILPLALEILHP